MLRSFIRKLTRKEAGQALPLFGLFVFVLFGFVAMSIDVGRYVWARTQMQAAVDSAALAAAQSMPNLSDANAKAEEYWLDNSGFIRGQGENVQFTVEYPEGNKANITPWVLFTVFVLGPCEPLIPILMYPASQHNFGGVAAVTLTFGLTTIATMMTIVLVTSYGFKLLPMGKLDRFSHAIAGSTIALSGLAIKVLGI